MTRLLLSFIMGSVTHCNCIPSCKRDKHKVLSFMIAQLIERHVQWDCVQNVEAKYEPRTTLRYLLKNYLSHNFCFPFFRAKSCHEFFFFSQNTLKLFSLLREKENELELIGSTKNCSGHVLTVKFGTLAFANTRIYNLKVLAQLMRRPSFSRNI